nr:MAG TPA: hypothetical protein [Caudoviricetes sp.]
MSNILLYEKRIAAFLLDGAPADPANPTVADAAGAVNLADQAFLDGTYLRPTNSATINYQLVNGDLKEAFGAGQAEGQLEIARWFDPETGLPDADDDTVWPLVNEKGAELWILWRVGPAWDEPLAADQEVSVYKVTTDNPQDPQALENYIRSVIPLAVSDFWLNKKLKAGA